MPAARVRGAFVGALSATAALAGHSLGGASVPAGSALVLLTLGAAFVGALAGMPTKIRVMPLTGLLLAGQGIGHLLLTVAGHQHHGGTGSSMSMLFAHVLAAIGCAALIVLAERGWRRMASAGQWMVLLVSGWGPAAERWLGAPSRWSHRPLTVRIPAHTALLRRGPPFVHR